MKKLMLLLALTSSSQFACRSTQGGNEGSQIKSSSRTLIIPDETIDGISFNFCPDKRSMSLINNMWLTYLSANSYAHFKEAGPMYERLGFGDPGEGQQYLKVWYALRLKRIAEKLQDTDDTWKTEAQRLERQEAALAAYREEFGEAYQDDGKTAASYQAEVVSAKNLNKKLFFLSSVSQRGNNVIEQKSSQAVYAEHPSRNFAVIVFRGTETDQLSDIGSDANIAQVSMEGLGKVHLGFKNAYEELSSQLIKILEHKSAQNPVKLWISGHSLGGALSTVMTADILLRKERGELKNVELVGTYNIGSPRVGDSAFAKNFDALAAKYKVSFIRFRNHQDLVTGIPTGMPGTNGYWHVGALGYYDAKGELFYGDGWKEIDYKSDIKNSTPTSAGDHKASDYFEFSKRVLLANPERSTANCELSSDNRPLAPYKEEPARRN